MSEFYFLGLMNTLILVREALQRTLKGFFYLIPKGFFN